MSAAMTKRERVEAALNLQETDRIPVYDILLNDAVIEHFTGQRPPLGEEGLKLKLQATARTLDMTRMAGAAPSPPREWEDADGFVHYQEDPWMGGGLRRRPFSDEAGAREWVLKATRRLQEPFSPREYAESWRAGWDKIRSYLGDDTVVLHGETGTGLDTIRGNLGLELFSYLQADDPGLVSEYLEVSTKREVAQIHAIADPALSPCALTYGDIAMKGRLLHSPAWLREEFIPRLRRVNDAWHEHGIKCLFHSDGYLMEMLPDLVATGIDGLNPIETVAGMDLAEVRQACPRLFLGGGIDISQLMAFGTPEEVRAACEHAIAVAAPGYFIGSTTEYDNGARLDSFLIMIEVAWKNR
ncbi:MAG: hypothetical protein GX100_13805 [candidate division WS1 bacterium]|nr:hypothetical protein [candidate division WS1 bacterium]